MALGGYVLSPAEPGRSNLAFVVGKMKEVWNLAISFYCGVASNLLRTDVECMALVADRSRTRGF